jgi:hypothetical protein
VKKRSRNLVALVALSGIAALAFIAGQRHEAPHGVDRDLLSAVPRDTFLVATFDMDALRASPLAQPLFASDAATSGTSAALLGLGVMGGIKELCGFDPLARVKELALAIPEGGDSGDFGLVAIGDLSREDFVACAEKIIVARGGHPRTSTRGSFSTIEDDHEGGSSRISTKSEPKLALKDGGPFLIGRGAWLEAMIDAADGVEPSVKHNDAHSKLRDALVARVETAKGARAIIATAALPKSLRERLKREMGAELGASDAGGGNASMNGVLGVEMAGLSLSAKDTETEVSVELRCESPVACDEVKKLIERKRLSFSQDFGVRLIGLGPLIDSLEVRVEGMSLSAGAHAPTDELARAIDRVVQLRRAERRPDAPDDAHAQRLAPLPSASPSASTREVIVPKRAAPAPDAARTP